MVSTLLAVIVYLTVVYLQDINISKILLLAGIICSFGVVCVLTAGDLIAGLFGHKTIAKIVSKKCYRRDSSLGYSQWLVEYVYIDNKGKMRFGKTSFIVGNTPHDYIEIRCLGAFHKTEIKDEFSQEEIDTFDTFNKVPENIEELSAKHHKKQLLTVTLLVLMGFALVVVGAILTM